MDATGGIISDYTTAPGAVYRAHIFTSSGTFNVTAIGDYGDTVEYIVVAGGGSGGGSWNGGGGGRRWSGWISFFCSGESSGGGASAKCIISISYKLEHIQL